MKHLILISLSFLFQSCAQKNFNGIEPILKKIKIERIDSALLSEYHLIRCIDLSNSDTLLIVSQKPVDPKPCKQIVSEKNEFMLDLEKINRIDLNGLNHNLYIHNIYIEGNLVFPRNLVVFKSNSLVGLCVK